MKTNTVPEEKQEFYYWLAENVSARAGNYWLEGHWLKFIAEIKAMGIEEFHALAKDSPNSWVIDKVDFVNKLRKNTGKGKRS